ncbi:MAG: hypothetical protein ACP6IU_11770 [Candidatus Asgardarchaeia archaeon]
MDYKVLYIFVEGNDDERFFQEIIVPILQEKYNTIKIIKYAQKSKKFEYIEKFIRSIQSMNYDYIYVTDINNSPCVTAKKQEIQKNLKNIDSSKILVVIREIESWYLAGLDKDAAKRLGIKWKKGSLTDTGDIGKEQFYSLIPRKYDSRIDFLREILKNFSLDTAKQKNRSLRYLIEKIDC